MYPYPSGDLHIGHWYAATGPDIVARMRRMQGLQRDVPDGLRQLRPAGRERGDRPRRAPAWNGRNANIDRMRAQFRTMGCMFDWSREVVTSDPDYYRWTQWLFVQFFKAGLAYRAMAPVDWCPKDQVVLAREQVEGADRHCWRCGTPVDQARPGAVVLPHHPLRGRAARLQPDRLAGADPPDADQLDRPQRGRRDRLRGRGRWGGADPRLHDAPRHDLRGDLHGARPGASLGGGADHARPRGRGGEPTRPRPGARPRSSG